MNHVTVDLEYVEDPLLPLGIVHARVDASVAEDTNVLALLIGNDLGHPRLSLPIPISTRLSNLEKKGASSPAVYILPETNSQREELRRLERVIGAEPFHFLVFADEGILVPSVRIGLFSDQDPLKRGRVGVPRLVVFPFVEDFIEEIHGGRNGSTTGIAGGNIWTGVALQRSPIIPKPPTALKSPPLRPRPQMRYAIFHPIETRPIVPFILVPLQAWFSRRQPEAPSLPSAVIPASPASTPLSLPQAHHTSLKWRRIERLMRRGQEGWRVRWKRMSSVPTFKSPLAEILGSVVARSRWGIAVR